MQISRKFAKNNNMTSTTYPQYAGYQIAEIQEYTFASNSDALTGESLLNSLSPANPVVTLPNGEQVHRWTNGEVFILKTIGKLILLILLILI